MKKILLIILLPVFIFKYASAQTPALRPNVTPGKNPLPTPTIKLLLPDLNVPAISFVEGHKDATAGKYYITLHLTINNSGLAKAAPCKLSLTYQRESTHGFYFASGRPELSFQALNANQQVSGDYTFSISLTDLGAGTYSIPVKVFIDCFNEVKESNENNNISAPITVTLHL